jgi:hypothetical protein
MTCADFLTLAEVAKVVLKCSPATCRRLGLPVAFYVGRAPRYNLAAVLAFLAARGQQGTKAVAKKAKPIQRESLERAGLRMVGTR